MNSLTHKLLMLALIVALPSLGCFSYYAVEDANPGAKQPALAILLAYPALLLSLATFIVSRIRKTPSRFHSWAAGSCFMVSAAILLIAGL